MSLHIWCQKWDSGVAVDNGDPQCMTTRSGLHSRERDMSGTEQTGAGGTGMTTDIQQVLQLLMEDRRKQEEEIAAKRERQEREMERRLQEMQQHVKSLLQVVSKTQEASGGPTSGAGSSHGDRRRRSLS